MRERRGIALLTALWLIIVLGVVATQVARSAYSVTDTAENVRTRAVARYAAESGIVLATTRIEDTLGVMRDSARIKAYLNGVEDGTTGLTDAKLGQSRIRISIVDVNARLDVNSATYDQLMSLFSSVTDLDASRSAARAIRNRIEYGAAAELFDGLPPPGISKPAYVSPLRSLSALRGIKGVSESLASKAAPFLTVDGDGHINRVTASENVIAAAGGDVRDMPSRLLIISRGWAEGRPLTFEIQAVYSLEYGKLVQVSWRERDL